MSLEALVYALNCDSVPDPLAKLVLIGLANHADAAGCNAFPAQSTLAAYAGCSDRSARRKLAELEDLGVIERGDQELVSHLPGNRRPVVWNLAGLSVRPDTRVRPKPVLSDASQDTAGHSGRTLLSDKPSLEPNTPLPPVTGCSRHATPAGRCRACRSVQETRAKAEARQRQAAERLEHNRISQAQIDRCGVCNDYGYLPNGRLCDHDPATWTRAKTGAALAREILAQKVAEKGGVGNSQHIPPHSTNRHITTTTPANTPGNTPGDAAAIRSALAGIGRSL